jgi:hypothetical protein
MWGNQAHDKDQTMTTSIPMTFVEFQATRVEVSDLAPVLERIGMDSDGYEGEAGLVYIDALYINSNSPGWAEPARSYKYLLHISNNEWLSDDLETLERKLYEFALDEGYIAEEPAAQFYILQGSGPVGGSTYRVPDGGRVIMFTNYDDAETYAEKLRQQHRGVWFAVTQVGAKRD